MMTIIFFDNTRNFSTSQHNDVILFENPPLARSLYDTVELDEPIPEELYKAVAEIISYVYKKQGKIK